MLKHVFLNPPPNLAIYDECLKSITISLTLIIIAWWNIMNMSLYTLSFDQHEQTKLIADISTITTVFFKAHKKQI